MWIIRGGEREQHVDRFVDEGFVGIEFGTVPDAEILTRTEIRRALAGTGSTRDLDEAEAAVSAFVNEIHVGASILLLDLRRGEAVLGEVTGPYEFHGDVEPDACRHRRAVTWLARHPIADLPAPVQGAAKQRVVLDQRRDAEWLAYVAAAKAGDLGRDPADRGAAPALLPRSRGGTTSTPRAPRAPRTPRATAVATRTCPSCHLQMPASRFRGELCVDCE